MNCTLVRFVATLLFWAGTTLNAANLSPSDQFRLTHNLVDGPGMRSDSGVSYAPYSSIEQELSTMETQYPLRAKHIQYGKTAGGLNLNLLKIEKLDGNASYTNAPAVEISGAIHGNEFLGIEDKLAVYFLEHERDMPGLSTFLAKGGVIYVIPVVNPDGYSMRTRENNNGADLNRDWSDFHEVESSALAQYLDQDLKTNHLQLKLTLDYHCCLPALITPWTAYNAQPEPADVPRFARMAKHQTDELGYPVGNAMQTAGYLAPGTTVDYFYRTYHAIALTIEGKDGGENEVFDKHIAMWDEFFNDIASGNDIQVQ